MSYEYAIEVLRTEKCVLMSRIANTPLGFNVPFRGKVVGRAQLECHINELNDAIRELDGDV